VFIFLNILSIISVVVGTWLLAFGLKIEKSFKEEEERAEKECMKIIRNVKKSTWLIYVGLSLITASGLYQIYRIISESC